VESGRKLSGKELLDGEAVEARRRKLIEELFFTEAHPDKALRNIQPGEPWRFNNEITGPVQSITAYKQGPPPSDRLTRV
jgi:hypothetical protein